MGSSAFARRYLRNHSYFLFLQVIRCFSSLRSLLSPGCPIRTSADQGSFAPPRGFSQLVASFVASESLGIHRTLLINFLVSSGGAPRPQPPGEGGNGGSAPQIVSTYASAHHKRRAALRLISSPMARERAIAFLLYVSFLQYVKDLSPVRAGE